MTAPRLWATFFYCLTCRTRSAYSRFLVEQSVLGYLPIRCPDCGTVHQVTATGYDDVTVTTEEAQG